MAKLNINGKVRDVQVEADTPLLWVIREQVGLTGTKYGCGVAQCGACSVHINGEVRRSCSIPVGGVKADRQDRHHRGPVGDQLASGAEGLGGARRAAVRLLPVRQIMAAAALLEKNSEADRRGHRRRDDQYLPLRHLSAHPGGRAHGRRTQQGEGLTGDAMTRQSAASPHFRAASSSSAPPPRAAGWRSGFRLPFGVADGRGADARTPAPRSMPGSSSSPTTPA